MSSNGDDEVFTSDKKGKGYTHKPSHPPPPLAGQPRPMARSQQPPDPGLVDATHMMSADALSSAASNPAFAAKGPGVARPRKASGPPPAELAPEDRTMMFNPNDMGSLTGAPPPVGRPGPTNPVRMGSPPPSSPGVASRRPLDPVDDGEDKTAMFDPSKFMPPGGLGGPPPPGFGGPPPSSPKPAPPRSSGLRKAKPAPAAPKAQEPEEHTTLFDPSKLNLPPEIAAKLAGGGGGSGPVKARPQGTGARRAHHARSTRRHRRQRQTHDPRGEDRSRQSPCKGRRRRSGQQGQKEEGWRRRPTHDPRGEDRSAKARAKGGDDLASRIKKKGADGDGKPMTREEKIAAAKPAQRAAQISKTGIKKKAPSGDSGGDDDKAERIKQAKAKAKERSGQSSSKGPKKVSQTKGNANARYAGRKSTIMGVDAESGVGKVLKVLLHPATLGVMGLFFIGGCIGLYAIISKVTAPPPPKYGTIEVTSVPNAANIEYDGVDLGAKTPYVIDQVEAGTLHSIRISSDNYTPQIRNNVTTEPGQMTQVHIVLEPSPGTLILGSVPDGAEIVIEGRVMDVTPCIIKDQPRVDNAFIQVTAKKEGFQDATATLKWVPGETEIKHTFDLEPVGEQ